MNVIIILLVLKSHVNIELNNDMIKVKAKSVGL